MVYSGGYAHKNFKFGMTKLKKSQKNLLKFCKKEKMVKKILLPPHRPSGPLPISDATGNTASRLLQPLWPGLDFYEAKKELRILQPAAYYSHLGLRWQY